MSEGGNTWNGNHDSEKFRPSEDEGSYGRGYTPPISQHQPDRNRYSRDRDRRRQDRNRDRDTDRDRAEDRDRDSYPYSPPPDASGDRDEPWNMPAQPSLPSASRNPRDPRDTRVQGENEEEDDTKYYSLEDVSDRDSDYSVPPRYDRAHPSLDRPYGREPVPPSYLPGGSNSDPRSYGGAIPQRDRETGLPPRDLKDLVNDGYEIPLDFPHTDDDDDGDEEERRRRYRGEGGGPFTTVDLGPGLYRPVIGQHKAPPHHSRSKDPTPAASQSSKLHKAGEDDSKEKGDKLLYGQDENEERGNWSGRFDFILSMLGYAVGLGNVWRFPYLCYRNGGGAFLFPFLIMMVVIGLPLFYLEAALGQFSSCGAMTCWHFSPIFKGVGVAMVMVSAMTGLYYNMILAWSLHYMFASFSSDLPFASCSRSWNTPNCKLNWPSVPCDQAGETQQDNGVCEDAASERLGLWNRTLYTQVTGQVLTSPSQEYWERRVLRFSSGIEDFGQPKWDLVLCLLLAWIICFLCLLKGIKTTGKVVYFTAIFPYIVLVILFFRGVTLDNAGEGIRYFITPSFGRLVDANVWKDAANQIFFSMSIAGGGLITLSSYNRFHNNILRDSLIVAVGDSMTCVLGGFVIFSYLGYMAGQLEVGIEDVAADGAGLAFVVYPEAVSNLPPPTLWALLFFFMLLTLGLDSQFAMIETVLTGVLDQFPKYRPQKTLVILSICCILFILGLPLTCPGGMYLLQLMDNYVGGMTLIILGFVELVAIVFVYGVNRFCQDINLMTGSTDFLFWKVTWCALSPLTIVFIFIFMFVDYKRSTYDDYTYPVWADVLGWGFTLASVLAIPLLMLYLLQKETEGDSLWEKVRLLSLPTIYWGPALQKHRALVTYVSGFQVDPSHGLKPRTVFANPGFVGEKGNGGVGGGGGGSLGNGKVSSIKSYGGDTMSQLSLRESRISVYSGVSRATSASDRTGATFETSI